MRNVVCTSKAHGVGPHSQAVRGGGFIFLSGQLALDPVTLQIIAGNARRQTERALQNIAVYGKIFGPHPPARTTVDAAHLPKDSLVEIDAIALE